MQFTITINQVKALEWGLNAQQALLFAFVYECPSWAKQERTENGDFYVLSKAKVIEELPLLTDKPDTVYRLLKSLAQVGIIELSSTNTITLVRLTKRGREWNRKLDGSEKYPTSKQRGQVGKKYEPGRKNVRPPSEKNPSQVGKKSDLGSEKNPTNQDTSYQDTNQGTSQIYDGAGQPTLAGLPQPVLVVEPDGPRCEIPSDMPGPKNPECKTYRTWANYAMAYHKRHGAWPVWNETVAAKVSKLIDRLGQADAPKVAAFYVLKVNAADVIKKSHPVGDLLANAEGYHTQWQTQNPVTQIAARQAENTSQNLSEMELALAEQRARRKANA